MCSAGRNHLAIIAPVTVALFLGAAVRSASAGASAHVEATRSVYAAGETAGFLGSGFSGSENVALEIKLPDGSAPTGLGPWSVTAGSGTFSESWTVCDVDCVGQTLTLTAEGQTSGLFATTEFLVLPPSMDYENPDWVAAEPTSYPHTTGGGAYDDRTINVDVVESLNGGDFACDDIVTFFLELTMDSTGPDPNQVVEAVLEFDANTTSMGNPGAGYVDIVNVEINRAPIVDLIIGEDTVDQGLNDDGGSTASSSLALDPPGGTPFVDLEHLVLTVTIDDFDPGESIVLRVDARLGCDPGATPGGLIQARLDALRVIEIDGAPVDNAIPGAGNQTIPLQSPGEIIRACCFPNGNCLELSPEDCVDQGGSVQDLGTTCANDPCTGACCFEASCFVVPASVCNQLGGDFQGVGTDCTPNPCVHACCFDDGSCLEVPQVSCVDAGGQFQGDGTDCTPNPCPQPTGACCFDDGSCDELTAADCETAGGVYQGDETSCTPNPCPQPMGACCFDDGSCGVVTEEECDTAGGDFQGDFTTCTPNPCPQPGACCFDDGSCNVITASDCETAGGTYQGDGTDCTPNPCPQPTGACCLDDGSCQVLTAANCDSAGGVYQGDETSCTPNPCPQPTGACCFDDGSCNVIPASDCETAGGTYQGDGTDCTPNPCPQATGACCLDDGSCNELTEADCDTAGGEYQGDGTDCTPNPCPQATGACCLDDGSCNELTEADCDTAGGVYQGDGTDCTPNPCAERAHLGWNFVDNRFDLTANQPSWWSVARGQPAGLSPFVVLDPGSPPGRPDPERPGERILRGFVLAWAVNANGEEIRWNHLAGTGTIVRYDKGSAWEYNAAAFQVVDPFIAHGGVTGAPGVLALDGTEYAPPFDSLLLLFQAVGSTAYSSDGVGVQSDTDLTLHPVSADLRQESKGPLTTKASFSVWNESEVKFSGAHRCITCWDQHLLRNISEGANHFLVTFLQTDHGKARIDGIASQLCDVDFDLGDGLPLGEDPRDVVSRDAALLGVSARLLSFNANPGAAAGSNLVGMGTESADIRYDATLGNPEEAQAPAGCVPGREKTGATTFVDVIAAGMDMHDAVDLLARNGESAPAAPAEEPVAPGQQDRVSATEKGSLLVFSKVELRWDSTGKLIQDTFLTLVNDASEDVSVQLYFVNGDRPTSAKKD